MGAGALCRLVLVDSEGSPLGGGVACFVSGGCADLVDDDEAGASHDVVDVGSVEGSVVNDGLYPSPRYAVEALGESNGGFGLLAWCWDSAYAEYDSAVGLVSSD